MSCRVFGRQLEFEAMNIAVETVLRRGARTIRADYIPTTKNGVIAELYSSLGFTRLEGTSPVHGATQWYLSVSEYVARKTHIRRAKEAS